MNFRAKVKGHYPDTGGKCSIDALLTNQADCAAATESAIKLFKLNFGFAPDTCQVSECKTRANKKGVAA